MSFQLVAVSDRSINLQDQPLAEHRLLSTLASQANAARRVMHGVGEALQVRATLAPRRVLRREVSPT